MQKKILKLPEDNMNWVDKDFSRLKRAITIWKTTDMEKYIKIKNISSSEAPFRE